LTVRSTATTSGHVTDQKEGCTDGWKAYRSVWSIHTSILSLPHINWHGSRCKTTVSTSDFDLNAFPEEQASTGDHIPPLPPAANPTLPPAGVPIRRQHSRLRLSIVFAIVSVAAFALGANRFNRLPRPTPEAHTEGAALRRSDPSRTNTVDRRSFPPQPTATAHAPGSVGPGASANNVSGTWAVLTHIQSTSYSRYEGLHLGYRIQLQQNGARVNGSGTKISEGGNAIRTSGRTPIFVSGTVAGNRLSLTFDELGPRRESHGEFVLLLDEENTLRGRFVSTAAQSSGIVEAHRLPE
jgi:hypothetical protein